MFAGSALRTAERRAIVFLILALWCVAGESAVVLSQPADIFADVFGVDAIQQVRVPVVVRGHYRGEIDVQIQGTLVSVSSSALAELIAAEVRESVVDQVRALQRFDGMVEIGEFAPFGLGVSFDFDRIELWIEPAPGLLHHNDLGLEDRRAVINPIEPSVLSGFANLSLGGVYALRESRPSFRGNASLEPVINYRGWVAEGRVLLRSPDPEQLEHRPELEVLNARLVRDFRGQQVRAHAGLVGYQSLTGFPTAEIYGVEVMRVEELDDSRPFQIRGSVEFVVPTEGRVVVFLNERPYRSFYLTPGSYILDNIPIGRGRNRLRVELESKDGLSELFSDIVYYDAALVADGRHSFDASAGVFRSAPTQPIVSGRYLYGLLPRWSIGGLMQVSDESVVLGARSNSAFPWGVSRIELAGSFNLDAGFGVSAGIEHMVALQAIPLAPTIQLRAQAAGDAFSVPWPYQDQGFSSGWYAFEFGYSQRLPNAAGFSIGAAHRRSFVDSVHQTRIVARFDKQFGREVSLSMQFLPSFGSEEPSFQGGVFLRIVPTASPTQVSISTDLDNSVTVAVLPQESTSSFAWDASAVLFGGVEGIGRRRLSGGVVHVSPYWTGEVRQAVDATPNWDRVRTETRLQASSAIAYADGVLALAQPIRDSFVIFTPRESLAGNSVGILSGGFAPTGTMRRMPIVVGDVRSYRPWILGLDGSMLPDGVSVGKEMYTAMLGYRQGARVRVGGSARVYVAGRLIDESGEGVALQAGEVVDASGLSWVFFTDREGNFEVHDITPGEYRLFLFGYTGTQSIFGVPEDAVGRFDLDDVLFITGVEE